MGQPLHSPIGYTAETCYACGVQFCMTTALYQQRSSDHGTFYCPNGHGQHYAGKTSVEKERDALKAQLQREQAARESAERSRKWAESRAKGVNIAAGKAKAKANRLIARVHAGVCPDCNRTFKQLAAHMKTKHGK